jgi:Lon protease-like protein
MDPRVKITPEVQQIFTLTTQIENDAQRAASAQKEARALIEKLKAQPQSAGNDALLKKLEEIAPEKPEKAEASSEAPTLTTISGQLITAVMTMQNSEMAPTATELEACKKQEAAYAALMAKWSALKKGT